MDYGRLELVMELIASAGSAKKCAVDAIQLAKEDDDKAYKMLEQAEMILTESHQMQTSLLSKEAQGQEIEINLLMIHSQDHLMTTTAFVELARELVELRQDFNCQLKKDSDNN